MEVKTGDILICKGKSWISRAIMKVTKGEWSHTAVAVEVWGEIGVIEAQKNGVNFKMWDSWRRKWDYEFIVFRNMEEFSARDFSIKAFSVAGETPYDWKTFFGRIPYRLFTGKGKVKNNEQKKMICSEYTAWVWNLPLIKGVPQTPQEQFEYLSKNKNWIKL